MENFCCTNCFSTSEIKEFIDSDGILGECDYCKSININICNVHDVGKFLMEGVERYYEDAANQVGYDSAEGGYLLPTTDIQDILNWEEEIFSEALDDPYPLLDDLVSDYYGIPYVRKDPYGPENSDDFKYWENFCKVVKTQQRFTTFIPLNDDNHDGFSQPSNFLFYLAETYVPQLINVLEPNTRIFRARIEEGGKIFNHIDLTSPPSEYSKNNRMSPAGISFFYGALDPETCVHEVRPDIGQNVMVGEFEVIQKLHILDLSEAIEPPYSIFDSNYVFSYEEFFKPFLAHFATEVSKHVRRSDDQIDYVPTQILTEFLKSKNFRNHYLSLDENGQKIDVFLNGILFQSSVKRDGKNLVLFRGPDISIQDREPQGSQWLLFKGIKTYQVTEIRVNSVCLGASHEK
jgi:hypothetical protein